MTIYGHDFLGLGNPNFSVDACIKGIRKGSAIGVFDSAWPGNFGDPYQKVRKILKSGKVILLRVQIYWSYQHKPCPLSTLKKALPRWAKLQKEFPLVKFYISPSCEYDASTPKKLVSDWIKEIRKYPGLSPVLSPMGGPTVPLVPVEKHGDKVRGADAVSLDGQSAADCDFAALLSANALALYFLAWIPLYNCAAAGNTATPPNRKDAPTVKDVKAVDALFDPCTYGDLKKPQLYKLMAEDHADSTDPRERKPLLILKKKAPFCEILDSKRGLITKFPYYGTYLDQGHRYYSGSGARLYGYEIAEIARKNTGSDVITARIGNEEIEIGSAQHRHGYYQA